MPRRPPPPDVLLAFGLTEPPRRLAGGQGSSWRSGDLVLKPEAGAVQEWLADTLATITPVGFVLAEPVRTIDGAWSHDGWSATRWVEGSEPDCDDPGTWLRILDVGRAFHRTISHLPRPDCLDTRSDRWAVADRFAWGEVDVGLHPVLEPVVARLRRGLGPLGAPQLVHGDLAGNVLLGDGLPPVVIDVSPYWRPPAYAEGVVIADALCWHDAPASLVISAGVPVRAVARALLFRLATTSLAASSQEKAVDVDGEAGRYERAADALGL